MSSDVIFSLLERVFGELGRKEGVLNCGRERSCLEFRASTDQVLESNNVNIHPNHGQVSLGNGIMSADSRSKSQQ